MRACVAALWGNLGSVRAFDAASGALYVLLGQGHSERLHVAAIDTATGTVRRRRPDPCNLRAAPHSRVTAPLPAQVTSHAQLTGDLGKSSEILLQLALAP